MSALRPSGSTREWRKIRARFEILISTLGSLPCRRCGRAITSADDWHLGHPEEAPRALGGDDSDLWPECVPCSTSAGATLGNKLRAEVRASADSSGALGGAGHAGPGVGVLELFAGPVSAIPAGKLLCNGASYPVADYPYLFAVIGYTFGGSGDFFNVPNLTDRFPIGAGTKALGTVGGSPTRTLTAANLPPHAHTIAHTHGPSNGQRFLTNDAAGTANSGSGTGFHRSAADTTGQPSAANSGNGPGTSTPIDILNPWISINYVIRAA